MFRRPLVSFQPVMNSRRALTLSVLTTSVASILPWIWMAGGAGQAQAAPLTWDVDGDPANGVGGTGLWDYTPGSLFWDNDGSAPNVAWTDATGVDTAVFGGTAGTVSLGAPVTANGLTFNVTGYTIDNNAIPANTLTLAGTTPTITVTNASDSATISAALAGTAISKAGAGKLILSGANTFTGILTVSAGVLNVRSATALGASSAGTTVASGAELQLQGGITVTEPLTLAGTGAGGGGALVNVSGNNTVTSAGGTLTLTAATTIYSATAGDKLTITTTAGTGNVITGTGTALTFDGPGDIDVLARPISIGTGTLTKNGNGTLTLGSSETTGAVSIAAGTLVLTSAGKLSADITVASGATFRIAGGTDAIADTNAVTVNTGGVFDFQGTSETIARLLGGGTVTRGVATAATLTLNSATNSVFSGVMQNGLGTLALSKNGINTVEFTGTNTFTGNTAINTGTILVDGVAGKLSSGTITIGDNNGADEVLTIGNVADVIAGTLDRLGDTTNVSINGSTAFNIFGPAAASAGTIETMGTIALTTGRGTISLTPASAGTLQINAASFTRAANTTALLRGTGLGSTGANTSRLLLTSIPTGANFVGTSTTAGAKDLKVVPWLVGDASATGAGSDFVTYDSTNGLRPLAAGEYATSLVGAAGQNVSEAGETFDTAGVFTAINALKLTGGTTNLNSSTPAAGGLTVTSGALLFTGTATLGGGGRVNFGTAPIIITATGNTVTTATVNTVLMGSGGLTVGSMGSAANIVELGGNNLFTGGVTVNPGITRLGSSGGLNPYLYNTVLISTASTLRLNGNSAVIGTLTGTTGSSTILENGRATAATLRIHQTGSTTAPVLQDGAGGGALTVIKTGTSGLTASASNSLFTGPLIVLQGIFAVSSSGRLTTGSDGTNAIVVASGGTFRLTNNSANNTDRVRNTATVNLRAGNFDFDNNANSGTTFTETVGATTIQAGSSTITVDQAGTGGPASTLTLASLARNAGGVVTFGSQANGAQNNLLLGADIRDRLVITAVPTLNDGIIGGWAYGNGGADFATYLNNGIAVGSGGTGTTTASASVGFVGMTSTLSGASVPAYSTDLAETSWDTTRNVFVSATNVLLTGGRTVNSLKVDGTTASGRTVDLGGNTLIVDTGGILYNDANSVATTLTFSNGNLTATGGAVSPDLVVRMNNAFDTLNLSANIVDNGGNSIGFTKTGPGAVTLSGTNTYTGATSIVSGILNIAGDAALGTAPGSPTAGAIKIYGSTLNVTSTGTLNANRLIEIGDASATISAASGATLTYNGAISNVTSVGGNFPDVTNLALIGAMNLNLSGNTSIGGNLTLNGAIVTTLTTPTTYQSGAVAASTMAFGGLSNFIGGTLLLGGENGNVTATYGVAGGVLSVGSLDPSASNLNIGVRLVAQNGGASSTTVGSLDLTGSANFIVRVNAIQLGVAGTPTTQVTAGSSSEKGTLIIGTNSDIYANTQIILGNSGGDGNTGVTSQLTFGSGSNTVITPLITVGAQKGNGRISIAAGGTLKLSGKVAGGTDLRIGYNNVAGTGTISTGVFDLTGGTFIADLNNVVVGESTSANTTGGGTGTFTIGSSASNFITANSITVGQHDGAGTSTGTGTGATIGTMSFGGGSLIVQNNLTAGLWAMNNATAPTGSYSSTGTVNLSGGTVNIVGELIAGNLAPTGATVSTGANTKAVGTINITGAAVSVAGDVELGDIALTSVSANAASQGTLKVNGGSLTVGGNINRVVGAGAVATQSTGFIEVNGGALDMTGGTIFASQLAFRSGSISNVGASGVTLDAGNTLASTIGASVGDALVLRDTNVNFNVALTGATNSNVHYENTGPGTGGRISGNLNLGAVSRTMNVENSAAAADLIVSGAISGSVTLTKTGLGTLLLDGTVEGGVQVNAGNLGGTGTIAGPVNVAATATLEPGESTIGTLATGALTFAANSKLALEINTAAATIDRTNITGNMSLDGGNTVVLTLSDLSALALNSGTFVFLSYTGTWNGGLFKVGSTVINDYDASTNPNSTTFAAGGNNWKIDYNYNGNSVALLAVPEPGALASLAGGLALLTGLRRNRRRR